MFKIFSIYNYIYNYISLRVTALTVEAKLRVAFHLFRKEKKNIAVRLGNAEDVPQRLGR